MKKVLAQSTKFIFSVFGIAILGLLMSLTYQALGRIFPGSFANQMWGLVLFDIAAMCWALAFAFGSGTITQYATAAIGFLTGFIGTLGMVAAEVILSGNLVTTDPQKISQWLVYGFIGATVIHAALLYTHHAAAADIHQTIEVGIARGEVTTEAIKRATKQLDEQKADLANELSAGLVEQVKRDLALPIPADPRMPFLPANPKHYEQTTLPLPELDTIPAAKIPQEIYLDLIKKYPTIPGTFHPNTGQDKPTTAPVPFPDESNNSSNGGSGKAVDQEPPTTNPNQILP